MGRPRNEKRFPADIQPWELELVKMVASRFRTTERDDLEAELARRLLVLKRRSPSGIRNWKAYLAKVLYNKAANWVRDRRLQQSKEAGLIESGEEDFYELLAAKLAPGRPEAEVDLRITLAQIWEALEPELRLLWRTLVETEGNRSEVARRMGRHRNTVHYSIRSIKKILEKHGFS